MRQGGRQGRHGREKGGLGWGQGGVMRQGGNQGGKGGRRSPAACSAQLRQSSESACGEHAVSIRLACCRKRPAPGQHTVTMWPVYGVSARVSLHHPGARGLAIVRLQHMCACGLVAMISPRHGLECTDACGLERHSLQHTGARGSESQSNTRMPGMSARKGPFWALSGFVVGPRGAKIPLVFVFPPFLLDMQPPEPN